MANLDAQLVSDLSATFFRQSHGWATTAILATGGATTIPVTVGASIVGIFDDNTLEGSERGGPYWWGVTTDDLFIGRYLTSNSRTFRIEAQRPEGDGRTVQCLLDEVTP